MSRILYWDEILQQQVERDATVEEQAEIDARASTPVPCPVTITMRQARRALFQTGKLAEVEAAIAAQSSPTKEIAQIEWDYSSVVWRNKELVEVLTAYMGWTSEETDDLFRLAATL